MSDIDRFIQQPIQEWVLRPEAVDCQNCSVYPATVKCCTYEPFLPNYLIGATIAQGREGPHDFDSLNYIPLGYLPSPHIKRQLVNKASRFGQPDMATCRFLRQGDCQIWPLNGGQCRSYYCKSKYAEAGLQTWRAATHYLVTVEHLLAQELLAESAFSPKIIAEQIALLQAHNQSQESEGWELAYQQYWRAAGSPVRAYYLWCYQRFLEMDPEQFNLRYAGVLDPLIKEFQALKSVLKKPFND